MNMSLAVCKQVHLPNLVSFPSINQNMPDSFNGWRRKEKVVVVMGATGAGKTRLSIDLARHFAAEIVNSDKMQVYKGLDIATNKVTMEERCGVPHHLLGMVDPDADFMADDFCREASFAVESIVDSNRLPIIVGGSNSYIETLIDDDDLAFRSKYECCFLWVDMSLPVLHSFVSDRVDRMVDDGLIEEVRTMFKLDGDYSRGIRRAIGVPEMDHFFRFESIVDEETCMKLLNEAIKEIKINNCKLAGRQLQKILRLCSLPGWNMHRLDVTDVLLKKGRDADEAWRNLVLRPSAMIVEQFLCENEYSAITDAATTTTMPTPFLRHLDGSHRHGHASQSLPRTKLHVAKAHIQCKKITLKSTTIRSIENTSPSRERG